MKIEIYTKRYCPFCHRAKALLDAKGLDYEEIEVSMNPALEQEAQKRSGRKTVPQVFINNHLIGGSDDLADAAADGSLDKLLAQKSTVAP
ncbi:MAG: glutaredoxin 3 [Leucothrix sp.]